MSWRRCGPPQGCGRANHSSQWNRARPSAPHGVSVAERDDRVCELVQEPARDVAPGRAQHEAETEVDLLHR